MRGRHLLLWGALLVPAFAAACNGILGIDAPTLEQDAGTDGRTADVTRSGDAAADSKKPEDGAARDARARDVETHDAKTDGGKDAGLFNGHCVCTSDAGCPPVPLVSGQASPQYITVDPDAGLFWANSDTVPGTIWHANLDGTNPTELAGNQQLTQGLTYARGYVYWTNEIGLDVVRCSVEGCTQQILGMDLPGLAGIAAGTTTVFAASGLQSVIYAYGVVDGGQRVFAAAADSPTSVATDTMNVYWTGQHGVYGCPLAGCGDAGPTVYGRSPAPGKVATNGTTLFWTDNTAFAVFSAPVAVQPADAGADGGPGAMLFFGTGTGIAADATHVYLAEAESIVRAEVNGNNVTVLAQIGQPEDLALSGTCVYWVDGTVDAGHVYATAK